MNLNVLIADDYDVVRHGIRALVEGRRAWKVCGEAATGREAVELSGRLHPDMLLLGLTLPDMDSTQAISEIMEVCPAARIVVLATEDSAELIANALAAGARGVVMKSDKADDLLATLEGIGNEQPFLSPAAIRLLQKQLIKNRTSEAGPHGLTPRELEILKLRALGWTNKAIAKSLDISVRTVDTHRANFMRKLGLATYRDLIRFAVRHNLIER